jgi:uncharacterized Fe-S cluster protein YjdI
MSDTDSPVETTVTVSKQMTFINLLKEHPVLLSKSQLPKIKERKAVAAKDLNTKYKELTGIELNEKQLTKKINNMKNDVKAKSDVMKTGNKPIILKDWEKLLLELSQAETNQTFNCVKGMLNVFISSEQSLQ